MLPFTMNEITIYDVKLFPKNNERSEKYQKVSRSIWLAFCCMLYDVNDITLLREDLVTQNVSF